MTKTLTKQTCFRQPRGPTCRLGTPFQEEVSEQCRTNPEKYFSTVGGLSVTPANFHEFITAAKLSEEQLGKIRWDIQENDTLDGSMSLHAHQLGLKVGFPTGARYGWDLSRR